MKKTLKWIVGLLLTPLLLFLLLAALLYVPLVQNWAVQRAARLASDELGMEVTVGSVRLKWPLDLSLHEFRAIHEGDTLADVGRLVADVQLLPLQKQRVVLNQVELNDARLNTNGYLSDLRVSGEVGRLWLQSRGIDLREGTVDLNGTQIEDTHLLIELSDTAAVDTTESEVPWLVRADRVQLSRSSVSVSLPGDTIRAAASFDQLAVSDIEANLLRGAYTVGNVSWDGGTAAYADAVSLSDVQLQADSIYYGPEGTRLAVRHAAMKEQSGLEVTELAGAVSLDSTMTRIDVPGLTLRTKDSDIYLEAKVQNQDDMKVKASVNAQIGKQDLQKLFTIAHQPSPITWKDWPNHPLSIRGSAVGSMERIELTGVDVSLPTALHAKADGVVHHLNDLQRLKADLRVEAEASDLNFATPLLADALPKGVRLPRGIKLGGQVKADGPRYDVDLKAHEGQGTVALRGTYNGTTEQYDADVKVSNLNVRHFLPRDSIGLLTADMKLRGQGFDLMKPGSRLNADATLKRLQYGSWNITDVNAQATLANGRANACLQSHNRLVDGTVSMDARLDTHRIDATLEPDLQLVDLYRLRLSDQPLSVGMSGSMELHSDLRQTHEARGRLTHLYIKDAQATYHPEDLGLYLNTNADTTRVRLQSGDLKVKLDAQGGYERLLSQATLLADSVQSQLARKVIDQPGIKRLLPTLTLHVESGRNNPLANILRTNDIDFRDLLIDLTSSAEAGLNGDLHLYALNADSIQIDTVALRLRQKGERLTYNGQVTNNRRNRQFVFNTLFDGHITEHGGLVGVRYFDDRGRMGLRLGASADMEPGGLRFRLIPERPTVGYKEFTLNADNYIFLDSNNRISAKVDLIADDGTGMKIYSENPENQGSPDNPDNPDGPDRYLQDLTVSLNRVNLSELTSVLPYMPRLSGLLNGDYHIVMDADEHISVASDMTVHNMAYEGSPIGNLGTELVYLQREDDSHAVEARLMLDDEEFGLLTGSLTPSPFPKGDGSIDAKFTMTRFPLSLANGLVPDQLIGLDGYGEGEITIKGTTGKPVVDGEVYLDSAYLVSVPYGMRMRFDNDPVRIVGSHLLLENFGLYAYNEEPLNLMGDIDFSDLDHVTMDMRMRARNLQLINAKQTPKSVAFGRGFVNFFARLNGPMEALKMRGRLDVLGSTDLTYMLLDSPLSTDNRLDELVKFTDFNDTTEVVVSRPAPTGLDVDLNISVSQGAHVVCNLNVDETNYIDLMGGGDLRMRYGGEGLRLTGRYTLSSGEMKYSLPVIPLKTFTIQDGSYVEFTGDPMNPRLNITATERTKATVSQEGQQGRSVTFDCGVVVTKTLSDMGLQFIISAPEDMMVNSDLQSRSEEERGKLAVTMLTTGMYLADGNTSAFSLNSALSSFLQSEINNITGSALKTLDLSVGLDNTTDAAGQSHTDYSFKFSKRLWDNRLKIELGGKVSSGASELEGQTQSFFDNVTMEYRLDQTAQKNVKLFYQQNVYDWLDGYTGLYGVGFVWRKKLGWATEQPTPNPIPEQSSPTRSLSPREGRSDTPRDSIKIGGDTP